MMSQSPTLVEAIRVSDETGGSGLTLRWSDGGEAFLASSALRAACPCAECMEQRGEMKHSAPLTGRATPSPERIGRASLTVLRASREESLNLQKVWPVGNYALGIQWGDGHHSGIYSFSLLRTLAEHLAAPEQSCAHD